LYICIEATGQWRVKTMPAGEEAVSAPLITPEQCRVLKLKLLADYGELAWRAALPFFAQRCHNLLGNQITPSPVKAIFDNLNQFFFNGFLPPLNIYWNSRLQLTRGRLVVCNPKSCWIELHPYCRRFEAILLREMVRYWVLINSGCACDTSPLFIEKCLEVRAPLNIEHYPANYYSFIRAVARGRKNR
ncbi:SprT family zinc-dependent metalloprotease, partial [Desulfotomaculum copahuensis]|uniref:SprT family zinc-dependent metalloprotease n=1 Tax=Desulfotomaculum copahuensis TaxID=1838280 RepID=UPI000A57CE4E